MDYNNYDEDLENDIDTEDINSDDFLDDEDLEQPIQDEEEKTRTIFDDFEIPKNKNMYFDEELVKDLIINQYQPYLEYEFNEKGKKVCISRDRASKEVEKQIMGNLLLIAKAIVNKYRYWRFEPYEDLWAESLKAMWYYLPNFTPDKGSAFDLFSIICKRHLLNYTLKNYKHRITSNVDEHFDLQSNNGVNYNIFFDNLEKTFLTIIDENYIGEKRKKYIELTSILMEYLVKNEKVVGKNDLLSAFKEYGYKSTEYKKFIEDMMQYKDEFYSICK